MTVIGIRKSEGSFSDQGKNIEYSNTVVTVLRPFSEKELEQGAIGMNATEYKIKGSQFYHDYQGQTLPAEAEMLFKLDVSKKTPTVVLVGMNFNIGKKG